MTPTTVLLDTDALIALLALDCFDAALELLEIEPSRCYRLPAAVAQAARARWVGDVWPRADRTAWPARIAELPALSPPGSIELLQRLILVQGIDEGEAYLVASLVEGSGSLLLTGDSRALRALLTANSLRDVVEALRKRVITFPQIVGQLVRHLSLSEVEHRWRSAAPGTTSRRHKGLSVLFGTSSPTRPDDFWSAHQMQIDQLAAVTDGDFFYTFGEGQS